MICCGGWFGGVVVGVFVLFVCLVGLHEENPASHRYVVGKGKSILITFLEIVDIFL